jgi:AbrB family looped-hinge helix DNA binding protein
MRTTIDGAGRIVIPKRIRDEAGLAASTEVEIEVHDGRIEIEPVYAEARLVIRDGHPVIEIDGELPPIRAEEVREILERVRDRR